jgi:hypothetical protein
MDNKDLIDMANRMRESVHLAPWTALREARMHGTDLVIWRDGEVVSLTPDEFERGLRAAQKTD